VNGSCGKILVIRGGAIGDFILTVPAIAALRQQFPKAFLEILGYPHISQLATAAGLVDRVSSLEGRALAAFFGRDVELAEDMRDYFSEFDLIVSYLYDPDQIFKTNVLRCSPAQFISGPYRPDEQARVHATKVFLEPLERLAIFEADPVPRLAVGSAVPAPTAGQELALHTGSGSESKNWPEDRWAELIQRLLDGTSQNLLLVGGEAEGERLQRLAAALPPTRVRVAQSLPLAQLATWLVGCRGFVGHDSGISHLAAAVGLRALVLWGGTAQDIWRPLSDHVTLLNHPGGLTALPVDQVFETVCRLWKL
jgi:heptosyltransferase III